MCERIVLPPPFPMEIISYLEELERIIDGITGADPHVFPQRSRPRGSETITSVLAYRCATLGP